MKFVIVFCALVAVVAGDVSHLPTNSYLAPTQHVEAASAPAVSYAAPVEQSYHVEAASAPVVSYEAPAAESYHVEAASAPVSYETASYETAASEPAHSYSANDGYRYKTAKRSVIRRQRRDVSDLFSDYLPPVAASEPVAHYQTAPTESVVQYVAPAASYETASYETAASEPAHSYSANDGYRYKTVKRRVIRRQRRDVSHLSSEYLPPVAASESFAQYESAPTESVVQYAAPAASYETASYETAGSEPAHSYSANDGYRYKTVKRRVIRRQRRDVSHLSSEYLPPVAASESFAQYESAPTESVVQYAAPAASYETASYETAGSEPAHSYSANDGYRYKTVKRRVVRRQRRDVSHLSSEYLPPVAASESVAQYESAPTESVVQYAAPAASYETASYETAASEPAHSYSANDGYRYKTVKRRVVRRQRRDVSHLSSEYLPPVAASESVAQYESAPTESIVQYAAPAASYETASYETAASEPAHSFSSAEGYRYRTAKKRVLRRHRY